LLGRIRLESPREVVVAAERTLDTIIEAYLGPNLPLHTVLAVVRKEGFHFLMHVKCRPGFGSDLPQVC
jgi:hypothetical protein